MHPPPKRQNDKLIKRIAQWLALLGAAIASFFNLYLIILIFSDDVTSFKLLIENHAPAVIGNPASIVTSYCLVIFLEANSGPIEFEALGFKFRGASGPIVLWIFVYLAQIVGITTLWKTS